MPHTRKIVFAVALVFALPKFAYVAAMRAVEIGREFCALMFDKAWLEGDKSPTAPFIGKDEPNNVTELKTKFPKGASTQCWIQLS